MRIASALMVMMSQPSRRNPLLFDPTAYGGIVVIRLSKPATLSEIGLGIETLIRGIRLGPVAGKLWIVDRGMIREYQPPQR